MPIALLSVSDKTGLIEIAEKLTRCGWELLASGGTARRLRENQIAVTEVSVYTGSPEILGGRVKTLHPAIHGGILARNTAEDLSQLKEHDWQMIDLVVANLYPFEETIANPDVTLDEAVEQIDIGGVALIRAAAKNFERVTLLCDPSDYEEMASKLVSNESNLELRRNLAIKGFRRTASYDASINAYLSGDDLEQLSMYAISDLRYGENPHQNARLYAQKAGQTPLGGEILQGKALSYNNLLDLDAAWRAVCSFEQPAVVIDKHLSPCGIAVSENLKEAYQKALASDPLSAFGGVVAVNREIDGQTAREMKSLFLECVIAPGFSEEALELLSKKKNCRLVKMPDLKVEPDYELRTVIRGFLMQSVDKGDPEAASWKIVTKKEPTEEEMKELQFAWKACQHVKSNAIVLVKGLATVGIGGGQPNRVDCIGIAMQRAGMKSQGSVMASDAFFPFPDSIEEAHKAGVTAIIQPGGSIRDEESIKAADEAGIAMVFTGVRHFRH
ncbi:MAG: bifunctional phosphoribosylaminoimidazolecarboxamide formyltransferase/IMP cyclohydrolase [Anaerolineaceae bacterium]|nr:bifunctional phosphoribosylaminoimidazolecarboxamide formyltransferase/IMP cyclohydrolase [Anaerolineaceae bacterium]